jgi:hypothetical protein
LYLKAGQKSFIFNCGFFTILPYGTPMDSCSKTEGTFILLKLNIYIIYLYVVDCGIQTKISKLLLNKTYQFNCSTFFIVNYQNFCLATLSLSFHHYFIIKELSDYPVDSICMAVSFFYSYVYINLNTLKYTVK